jgi:hypothetical protein
MLRRKLLGTIAAVLLGGWAGRARAAAARLIGILVQQAGRAPALRADSGGLAALDGEPETLEVLNDARLAGERLELIGQPAPGNRFRVGPFYQAKSMFVHRGAKRFTISYWCQVCSIRTYTPGLCMCCRDETELSLQDAPP